MGQMKNYLRFALPALVLARLVTILAQPLQGLLGYGDVTQYMHLAQIPGLPFLSHWTEYPPLFPFLLEGVLGLSGGQEHVFAYAMVLVFLLADVGSLLVFTRLVRLVSAPADAPGRVGVYFLILCVFAYTWWYFEPLVVFTSLLSLLLLLEGKSLLGGAAASAGVLLKLFPVLNLVVAWKKMRPGQALRSSLVALAAAVIAYAGLWAVSPDYTRASLVSQAQKSSWQTIWALVDGNFQTGNFGPLVERLDPSLAQAPLGRPPVISPWLALVPFLGVGFWRFTRATTASHRSLAALAGFTWTLFFLWSPGWSPQWVLYLIPLALLCLPLREAALFSAVLIFTNLLEWPVLLSRGLFWTLPVTVLLRTFVLVGLALSFDREMTALPVEAGQAAYALET